MSKPPYNEPERSKHEPLDLDATQRWLQSVIVHPGGVAAGIESPAAQDKVELTAGRVDEVICRSNAQTSIERLEVYSNAYKSRLLEVLIGEYPAMVQALGEEVFVGLAGEYLEAHPPRSYTLGDLGRSFPDYLTRSRPANQNEDSSPDWADFLIDLARLERIYSEVFDGPGIEDQPTLQPNDLRDMSPELWLAARLIPAPCLRLATFRFSVHEYATAVRHQQEPEVPAAQPTRLAITRRDYIVRRVELGEHEFRVLSALVKGRTVGEALERAAANYSGTVDELASDIRHWFRNWSAAGYFTGLHGLSVPTES